MATARRPIRMPRCSRRPGRVTRMPSRSRCATGRGSRRVTRRGARRCCWRRRATTSRRRGCWWRWGPTPTPSTTSTTRRGWSPGSRAAWRCSRRCCRRRPTSALVNRFGGVSVIPASERGHVEYVRRVVSTGIDVNHVNSLGWTALLEAVILGDGGARHQEIVRILLAPERCVDRGPRRGHGAGARGAAGVRGDGGDPALGGVAVEVPVVGRLECGCPQGRFAVVVVHRWPLARGRLVGGHAYD